MDKLCGDFYLRAMLDRLRRDDSPLSVTEELKYLRNTGLTYSYRFQQPGHVVIKARMVDGVVVIELLLNGGFSFINAHQLPPDIDTYKKLHAYLSAFLYVSGQYTPVSRKQY